jgi:cbb3-type cytochrome oxidase subunit 3
MIEFENILFLLAIGIVSLIVTIYLFLTSKKVDAEKENESDISDVKIFNTQIKLVPFLYLAIVLTMFVIGIFSDFLNYSVFGLIIALIPFLAYWVFDYKKDEDVRR